MGKADQLRSELADIATDVTVTGISCDVSDKDQVRQSLDAYKETGRPAVRGVVHGGMELKV
jgi:hypothetical protein